MTLTVNIDGAAASLADLVAASQRGEQLVLQRAGVTQARIVPIVEEPPVDVEARAAKRQAAFERYARNYKGPDLPIEMFQNLYPDPEERYRRKFGSDT